MKNYEYNIQPPIKGFIELTLENGKVEYFNISLLKNFGNQFIIMLYDDCYTKVIESKEIIRNRIIEALQIR